MSEVSGKLLIISQSISFNLTGIADMVKYLYTKHEWIHDTHARIYSHLPANCIPIELSLFCLHLSYTSFAYQSLLHSIHPLCLVCRLDTFNNPLFIYELWHSTPAICNT